MRYMASFVVALLVVAPGVGQEKGKGKGKGKAIPPVWLFRSAEPMPVGVWAPLELPKAKEPAAVVKLSDASGPLGKDALQISFAGGVWPTIATTKFPEDWTPYRTF